jgi:hypothetical protein
VAGFLPQATGILVLVNSAIYGGATTGDVAAFTTEAGWEDVALHEFGHVLGLADEYGSGDGSTYNVWDSLAKGHGLPNEPNVTTKSDLAGLKWGNTVATTTLLPTTPGSVPTGTVGMFESAKYYDFGLFRPQQTCRMKVQTDSFCAVCCAAITQALAPSASRLSRCAEDPPFWPHQRLSGGRGSWCRRGTPSPA